MSIDAPAASPPSVDVKRWREAGDRDEATRLVAAARGAGIARLLGHGVDPAALGRARAMAKRFFDLPVEEKRALAAEGGMVGYRAVPARFAEDDRKETYLCGLGLEGAGAGGAARWPAIEGFREAMLELIDQLVALGCDLLRALEVGLGAVGALSPHFTMPTVALRLSRYPADEPEGWLGANAHVDLPAFGILDVGDVPGLEFREELGEFRPLEIVPGTLVWQVGALLGRWSNDVLRPNVHRVRNAGPHERISIVCFLQPPFSTEIRCLDACHDAEHPPRYAPITVGAFVEEWLAQMTNESRKGALLDG